MLYVDIPVPEEIAALAAARGDACVSIYLPTTPLSQQAQADRIALKNLSRNALQQLQDRGVDKRRIAAIGEQLDDLIDDYEFWRFQAHSLAIFATPENLRTFRVPNALEPVAFTADRFHLKPLLRSVSFPNSCYVLALAQKSVRLIEVSPDLPSTAIHVEGMPTDAGRAVQGVGEVSHWPSGRIQAAEGQKVLLRQFARQVDKALRPILTGSGITLILAAAEPVSSLYRSVNTYRHLAAATIEGSPEGLSEAQLAERARPILDQIYQEQVDGWRQVFAARANQGRATTDVAQAARAATAGAVDSMLADIDAVLPGNIDANGAVTFAAKSDASNYDLIDEIAARVLASSGRVIAVRRTDIPGDAPLAAILRYAA
jgi:hypothetical protein